MKKVSQLLQGQKVIPVVVLENVAATRGLCKALLEGGINVIEVTLRNAFGLSALEVIKQEFPDMVALAGTVNSETDMQAVADVGADGVISPGLTPALIRSAKELNMPYMPGVASGSEILLAMEHGLSECKLFPASVVGGIPALKAFAGPFKDMRFCPTGGVGANDYKDYLALENVICVGGSWLAPATLIERSEWAEISKRSRLAVQQV